MIVVRMGFVVALMVVPGESLIDGRAGHDRTPPTPASSAICRQHASRRLRSRARTFAARHGLLLASLGFATACAVNPVTGERELQFVSESQELAAICDRPLPYEFVAPNSSIPNAWALPGGDIAVNHGLVTAPESTGIVQYERGELARVEDWLTRGAKLLPSAPAIDDLGNIARQRGDFSRAMDLYSTAAGSNTGTGRQAAVAYAELDLPRNPGKYVATAPQLDGRGRS